MQDQLQTQEIGAIPNGKLTFFLNILISLISTLNIQFRVAASLQFISTLTGIHFFKEKVN